MTPDGPPLEMAAPPPGIWSRLLRSVWLRVAVTIAILAVVAAQIDWALIEERLRDGHPLDFAIAVGLLVVALAIGAWRWNLLLRHAGISIGAGPMLRAYAVSTFSATFLPTTAGGDVARALLVARRGPALTRAAVTVLVDRAAGLGGLLALAWIAFALNPAAVPDGSRTFLLLVSLLLVAIAVGVAAAVLRGAAVVRRFVPRRMLATARETWIVLRGYIRSPALLAEVTFASVVFQVLVALQVVVLARAIEVDLPFATAAVALTLVTIVILVPISIGGFGVREGSYVVLLGGASVSATDATLISVLSIAALFVASLPGAWLLARGGIAPALETTPT